MSVSNWIGLTLIPAFAIMTFNGIVVGEMAIEESNAFLSLNNNPDSLYAEAREKAQQKSYEEAKAMLRQVIEEYPKYWGVHIYLARVLGWEGKFEESNQRLKHVNEDARRSAWWTIYVQNAHWKGDQEEALKRIENAPDSLQNNSDLVLIKARALHNLGKSMEGLHFLENSRPHLNERAETLLMVLNNRIGGNYAGAFYKYSHYEQNDRTVVKGRGGYQIGRSQVLLEYTHARRFSMSGNMVEIEAYPVFSKNFYAMLAGGVSDKKLHPGWYADVEPFFNLPGGWELSAGGRLVSYRDNSVQIAKTSVSKYLGSWLNTLRFSYVFEEQNADGISIDLTSTYFFQSQFHRLTFRAAAGQSSPLLYDEEVSTSLSTWRASVEFIFPVHRNHHLNLIAEYGKVSPTGPNANMMSLEAGYLFRF